MLIQVAGVASWCIKGTDTDSMQSKLWPINLHAWAHMHL